MVTPWLTSRTTTRCGGWPLPCCGYRYAEGLFVTSASPEYEALLGAEVLAFDGRPVEHVIAEFDPLVSRDNERRPLEKAPGLIRRTALLYAMNLIDTPGTVTLTTRTGDTEMEPSRLYAAGGVVSTGSDRIEYFRALNNGEVVDAAQLTEMRDTVPMDQVPDADYGLGLIRFPVSCDVEVWGQAGNVRGFSSIVAITKNGERAVNVSVNQSPTEEFGPPQLLGFVDQAVC